MLALKLENLLKTYDNGFEALKSVNLEIKDGDFFGLLGPNGAGKSTLLNILSSLLKKTSGKVFIKNIDIDVDLAKAKNMLGIVPQEINLSLFDTVIDVLIFQAGYYGVRKKIASEHAEKYLHSLNLWNKRNEPIKNLSGGMKRRVMIARALIHNPEILILDEPTAGIDIDNRHSMWKFLIDLNKEGKTILLTTHYLEEIENLCNNIAIINDGKIKETGPIKKILSKLDEEIYIIECENEAIIDVKPYEGHIKNINSKTYEITANKIFTIGDIISYLISKNVKIISINNKYNRLEKYFLQVTKD